MATISLYNLFVFKDFVRFLRILHKQVMAMGFSVLLQRTRYFLNPLLAFTPHNSNPKPANAAALLKQQLAATSAAGAFDVDSSGSDATC